MNHDIDKVETMIAHLICADKSDGAKNFGAYKKRTKTVCDEIDAGVCLRFPEIRPRLAYTSQLSGGREFATDAGLLLNTPQDILGNLTEIALVSEDIVKWAAFKRLFKRPRGVWVESTGADLYEYHSRFIGKDGSSDYTKRVAAISKTGKPVRVVMEGTKNQSQSVPDGVFLVLAASIVEDSMRPGSFQATISESAGVIVPVPQGEHLEVFKLRDGPLNGSRKKALLHWVARHVRKTASSTTEVKSHLRGIHEFEIDGLFVKLKGAA